MILPPCLYLGRSWLDRIKSGKVLKSTSVMAPPRIRGNWREISDTLAWKLHRESLDDAAKLMYGFLAKNADVLDRNLEKLPGLHSFLATEGLSDRFRIIGEYLQLLISLLR